MQIRGGVERRRWIRDYRFMDQDTRVVWLSRGCDVRQDGYGTRVRPVVENGVEIVCRRTYGYSVSRTAISLHFSS